MGGVGPMPWRLPAVEAALAGGPATPASFRRRPRRTPSTAPDRSRRIAFKLALMQRTLVRALTIATA